MVNLKKIKGRMAECGMSQKALALALGLSKPTISLKLSGARPLYIDEAEKLIHLLNIEAKDIGTYFFS